MKPVAAVFAATSALLTLGAAVLGYLGMAAPSSVTTENLFNLGGVVVLSAVGYGLAALVAGSSANRAAVMRALAEAGHLELADYEGGDPDEADKTEEVTAR